MLSIQGFDTYLPQDGVWTCFSACDLCWRKTRNDPQDYTNHKTRKQVWSINSMPLIHIHTYIHCDYEPWGKHHSQIIKQSWLQTKLIKGFLPVCYLTQSFTWNCCWSEPNHTNTGIHKLTCRTSDKILLGQSRLDQTITPFIFNAITHYEGMMCTNKELTAYCRS